MHMMHAGERRTGLSLQTSMSIPHLTEGLGAWSHARFECQAARRLLEAQRLRGQGAVISSQGSDTHCRSTTMPNHPPASDTRLTLYTPILGAGLVMGLALGIRHVQGLFMLPMTMEHGWSRETFSLALAIQNLVFGLAQPVTGMLADRLGGARVLAAGAVLYGIGLATMAFADTPAALLLGCGVVIGVALSCTAFGVVYGILSRMTPEADRGWALGLAGAVGGAGQFIAVPATQALQDSQGWVGALLVLGGVMALMAAVAPLLKDRPVTGGAARSPQDAAPSLRSAVRQALRHRSFWLLNLGFLACGFQLAFIASHLPAYLLDRGAPPQLAVAGLAVIALTNIVGTYACSRLGDIYRGKYLLTAVYLLRTAAMALFVLCPLSATSVYLFCGVLGLLWLGTAPLTNALVLQLFGVQYIGTLFGLVFLGHQLGAFMGVWLGGHVFDATRSYDLVWLGAIALGLIAAGLHWPIDDRPVTWTTAVRAI
jgi:MFS family permease